MILLKHNQQHKIIFSFCSLAIIILLQLSKVQQKNLKVKCPTEANTDLHNGDLEL